MLLNKVFSKKFFLFIFFIFSISFSVVDGAQDDKLKGYAWSDGAGWISFNCTNTNTCDSIDYGVTADAAGNLSGYAWSDRLGWLSFYDTHLIGISGAVRPSLNLSTGAFSGHAIFLAGSSTGDDGWLGLVDLSASPFTGQGLILDTNTYEINGWAWGDVNTGWVSFNCLNTGSCGLVDYQVTYDPFDFSFSANRGTLVNKVPYNGSVVLSWTTNGASGSCTASEGTAEWRNANPQASSGSQTILNMVADTIFELTCQDSSGNTITRTLNIFVDPPFPIVTLGADSTNIPSGTSTNLNWTAQNVSSCVITGPNHASGTDVSGDLPGGSLSTGALSNSSNYYEIECISDYPLIYPNEKASIYIDVEKLIVNLWADMDPVPYGEKIRLWYNSEFAVSCIPGTPASQTAVPGWETESINLAPGDHFFDTTDPITNGGTSYGARLTCTGTVGQTETRTVNLMVRKNPSYQEI